MHDLTDSPIDNNKYTKVTILFNRLFISEIYLHFSFDRFDIIILGDDLFVMNTLFLLVLTRI